MKQYRDILEKQLALDYDCSVEDVRSEEIIFKPIKLVDGARPICDEETMFKLAVYKEKLLVMADENILAWCKERFGEYTGTWISEPGNLLEIEEELNKYGQTIADTHHYYLPVTQDECDEERFETKIYRQNEIDRFEDDDRFGEAILFAEDTPDEIAVVAMDGETILGMAGATHDTDTMWQIGVNVTKEGRGKGVGSYVIKRLKNEVLKCGIVPFYATVESHIKSQKVAIRAGFEPTFYELFSEPK